MSDENARRRLGGEIQKVHRSPFPTVLAVEIDGEVRFLGRDWMVRLGGEQEGGPQLLGLRHWRTKKSYTTRLAFRSSGAPRTSEIAFVRACLEARRAEDQEEDDIGRALDLARAAGGGFIARSAVREDVDRWADYLTPGLAPGERLHVVSGDDHELRLMLR